MQTNEIVSLTRQSIAEMLHGRADKDASFGGENLRQQARWAIPGTVEIRMAGSNASLPWIATCRDLSEGGLGMICERAFETGVELEIAVHVPEASFCGFATVRYSAQVNNRDYLTGLQFKFDDEQ